MGKVKVLLDMDLGCLECGAFLAHCDTHRVATPNWNAPKATQQQNKSIKESNGIPICPVHDKAMREGKFGYYCATKEDDPELANNNGYCKFSIKK